MSLRLKYLLDDKLLDLFMPSLKESIQHEVILFKLKSMDKDLNVAKRLEGKSMVTRRVSIDTYRERNIPTPNLTKPTRLTPHKLDERREKDYVLIVTKSIVRGISVVRRNYST